MTHGLYFLSHTHTHTQNKYLYLSESATTTHQQLPATGTPWQQNVKAKGDRPPPKKIIHRKQSQEFSSLGSFNTGTKNTPHCHSALKALPYKRGKDLILKGRILTSQERVNFFSWKLGSQGSM